MNLLVDLASAVDAAREVWPEGDVQELAPAALIALNDRLGKARRLLDATHARVAAEIARQSVPELGPEGLAKSQGFRNPTALIAATTGTTGGEANRLIKVGEATAPRATFTGEPAKPRHPFVADGVARGDLTALAASAIVTMLDRVALRADRDALDDAERLLVEKAPGLAHDQLSKLVLRVEARLDRGGVARREEELRADRSLYIREEAGGMVVLTARLDPEHAAPVKTAIEALVSADLRAQRDDGPDAVRRSIPQLQADALCMLAEHALGCSGKDLPLEGATVIVRMNLEDLVAHTGTATIDGISAPVSTTTARRMAAGGSVIPCVLGGDSEILDWGRRVRLFTTAQKLALGERDGGCAMCGAPPSHTKAHHIRWWARDAGPTDLANGVLLCESCHHRIHDNGWEIRVDGIGVRARVWFIPPAHVDPDRMPRLGGRARFDAIDLGTPLLARTAAA